MVFFTAAFLVPSNLLGSSEKKPRPDLNGRLLHHPEEKTIYWIDKGHKRSIPNMEVLDKLFLKSAIREFKGINQVPDGPHVLDKNELIKSEKDPDLGFTEEIIREIVEINKYYKALKYILEFAIIENNINNNCNYEKKIKKSILDTILMINISIPILSTDELVTNSTLLLEYLDNIIENIKNKNKIKIKNNIDEHCDKYIV